MMNAGCTRSRLMRVQLGGHHCKLLIQLWKEEILGVS